MNAEEIGLTSGMPPAVAAGFIAARRGGDVRTMQAQNEKLAEMTEEQKSSGNPFENPDIDFAAEFEKAFAEKADEMHREGRYKATRDDITDVTEAASQHYPWGECD